MILDRNGAVLAQSATAYTVCASPRQVDDQLRVVNLPQVAGDTSTQTVANNDGEKING